jgi:hypothetical protein
MCAALFSLSNTCSSQYNMSAAAYHNPILHCMKAFITAAFQQPGPLALNWHHYFNPCALSTLQLLRKLKNCSSLLLQLLLLLVTVAATATATAAAATATTAHHQYLCDDMKLGSSSQQCLSCFLLLYVVRPNAARVSSSCLRNSSSSVSAIAQRHSLLCQQGALESIRSSG